MMRTLEPDESLELTLDLNDRLKAAQDPVDIIGAIHQALYNIRLCPQYKGSQRLPIRSSDTLAHIHAEVAALYKSMVIPDHYLSWWKEGQKLLDEREKPYTDTLQKLRAMSSSSERDLETVKEMLHDAHVGMDPNRRNDPPAEQKQYMEKFLETLIEKCRALRTRLAEHAPPNSSNAE